MTIFSLSFPNASLDFLPLVDRMVSTIQDIAITKVVLVIFGVITALYLVYWMVTSPYTVTVTEEGGNTYRTSIDNVNGRVTVVFDSFLGSGVSVDGNFTNGLLNGPGGENFRYGSVRTIEGEYNYGRLVQGTITYRNGTIDVGACTEGRLHGQGRRIYPDDRVEEGTFANGGFEQGTITRINGSTEVGAFIEGQLQGQGRRTHPDGQVEEGIFGNGQLNQGTNTALDGIIEVGAFIEGQLQGQGRRTYPNGRVEEGYLEMVNSIKEQIQLLME